MVSDVVTNIYDYSEANTSRAYEVLLGDGDFNVNLRTPVFSKLLDTVDIQAGHLSRAIDAAVEQHPVLGAGLTIVGVGLAIADPVGAGLSIALTAALKQGEGPLEERFAIAGYGKSDASAGRAGLPFILGIAGGSGISKILGWVGGKIEGIFSNTLGSLFRKGAAEEIAVSAPSTSRELVPVATASLGEWGETRLSSFLGGQGVKPKSPFSTPYGKRYPDRLLNGISYESKAGLNVGLTSNFEIAKDPYLINAGRIKGAEWHFWRGAQPELIQALQNAAIKAVIH